MKTCKKNPGFLHSLKKCGKKKKTESDLGKR